MKGKEIVIEIEKFSKSLTQEDEFVFVSILAHGKQGKDSQDEIVGVDGESVPTSVLTDLIIDGKNCPVMIGKPKIFLIQVGRHITYYSISYLICSLFICFK